MNVTLQVVPDGRWYTAGMVCIRYVNTGIATLGVPGNLLIIATILARKPLREMTTSLYLLSLAVVDCLVLITGSVFQWLDFEAPYDWRVRSEFNCRAATYVRMFLLFMEAWILIDVTLERLASVLYPHRVRVWFTKVTTVIVICITIAGGTVLAAIPTARHRYVTRDGRQWCDYNISTALMITNQILTLIIPFLVLLIGGVVIGIKSHASSKHVVPADQHPGNDPEPSRAEIKRRKQGRVLTKSMVLISFVFIALSAPVKFIFLYLTANSYMWRYVIRPSNHPLFFIRALSFNLYHLNSAVNIFLFALKGSKFRQQLIALFRILLRRRRMVVPFPVPKSMQPDVAVVSNEVILLKPLPGFYRNRHI